MSPARSVASGLTLVAVLLGAASSADARPYRGSPAHEKARAAGRRLVEEVRLDIDGDGEDEVGVVERDGGALRVRVLEPTGSDDEAGGFRELAAGTPERAENLLRLEARPMAGRAAPELLAVFEEPSPDEDVLSVRIMSATGAGVEEIFEHTFLLPKRRVKRPEGERVSFGNTKPHYLVKDVDGDDSDLEVVWVRAPQTLVLQGKDGPVTYEIGALRTVFRYDADARRYVKAAERDVEDFLPPRAVSKVEASGQAPKIWGTAQPFWGTDGDLETSWNVKRRGARGQSLTVRLKDPGAPVSMIRVVPGCGGSADEWKRHHRIRTFRLVLGSGKRFEIDRMSLDRIPSEVQALDEFPLPGGYGAQVLIVLEEKAPLPWARLEIVRVDRTRASRSSRVDEVCLSEISFH